MNRWNLILSLAITLSIAVLGTALLAGCATADPPMVKDGCAVNLKKVCQYVIDQNLDSGGLVAFSDGQHLDRQRLQNLSVRHLELEVPFNRGSGALLHCVVDTQSARVTDGGMADGPALNDADIEHIRQAGLCS